MILYRWRGISGSFVFFAITGSAIPRSIPYGLIASILSLILSHLDLDWIKHPSPTLTPFVSVVGFLVVYRSNLGYQRLWAGRAELATMTSKLKDVAYQLSCQTDDEGFKSECMQLLFVFTNTIFGRYKCQPMQEVLDTLVDRGLLDHMECQKLERAAQPATLVWRWLYRKVSVHSRDGGFFTSAPIQSRTYQMMSDFNVPYNNANSLRDTPFPFAFAQTCFWSLHVLLLVVPWNVAEYVSDWTAAACTSFLIVTMFFTINFAAAVLESPFDHSASSLPVHTIQSSLESEICTIMHPDFGHPDDHPLALHHPDGSLPDAVGRGWPEHKWERYFKECDADRQTNNQRLLSSGISYDLLGRAMTYLQGGASEDSYSEFLLAEPPDDEGKQPTPINFMTRPMRRLSVLAQDIVNKELGGFTVVS